MWFGWVDAADVGYNARRLRLNGYSSWAGIELFGFQSIWLLCVQIVFQELPLSDSPSVKSDASLSSRKFTWDVALQILDVSRMIVWKYSLRTLKLALSGNPSENMDCRLFSGTDSKGATCLGLYRHRLLGQYVTNMRWPWWQFFINGQLSIILPTLRLANSVHIPIFPPIRAQCITANSINLFAAQNWQIFAEQLYVLPANNHIPSTNDMLKGVDPRLYLLITVKCSNVSHRHNFSQN